jgi:predicted Zn-dependent protease
MTERMGLEQMMGRIERALAYSPADSTEIAWVEARRSRVASDGGREQSPGSSDDGARWERSLLIRVRQSGRTGLHRTGGVEASDLENAVRDALAQARLAPATPGEPLAGPGLGGAGGGGGASGTGGQRDGGQQDGGRRDGGHRDGGQRDDGQRDDGQRDDGQRDDSLLHDPELADLEPARARDVLDRAAGRGERLRLAWLEGLVAVANSAGLRRTVRVTAAGFEASCGRRPGGGTAAAAARRLDGLDMAATLDRARARHAGGGAAGGASDSAAGTAAGAAAGPGSQAVPPELPSHPMMVLSEQAVAALLDLLNRQALSAAAQHDDTSWLHGRLGEPLFAPCLSLRDDGTDPRALPFPFDLAGWPKRPVDFVVEGVFASPAVDPRLARELGRQPTPHALAPDEWLAANLLLLPGNRAPLPEPELLALAERGIWIGALAAVECFEPRSLRFRALARGVRSIAGGTLGPPLPDLLWEDALPAVLARVQALGDQPVAIATGDMLFGATAAPLLAVQGAERLSAVAARA